MKIRLDQYLVQHGLIQSRERAKAMIMSGVVFVNEQKVDKAGEMIKEDAKVEVRGHDIGYVSRGGLKLEKAMQCFPLTPNGKVCMDIGASTGGFTDCMLQNGAVKVYAVDVGYGQLAWKLRTEDPAERAAQAAKVSADLGALREVVPSIVDLSIGPDVVGGGNWDVALVADFADRAGLDAYQTHPDHQAVAGYIRSVVSDRVAVDFEV